MKVEGFVSKVEAINGAVNSFAWGPLMLLLLVGTGVFLTVKVNWLQVTHFGRILKNTIGTLFQGTQKIRTTAPISPPLRRSPPLWRARWAPATSPA